MTLRILDTDILTLFQRGHPKLVQHCLAQPAGTLALTIITVEEQTTGWLTRLRQAKRRDEVADVYQSWTDFVDLTRRFEVLPFPEPAILRFEDLLAHKLNVRKMDLRIAAIALESRAVLVTRNTRDFQRIAGLALEDWTV
jgi:tRNA(fMet)-specific endonuclease VapC